MRSPWGGGRPMQPGQHSLPTRPNTALARPVRPLLGSHGITGGMSPLRLQKRPRPIQRLLLPTVLALLCSAPVAADKGQDHDQQTARRAVREGKYVPLENVVRDALRRHPGKLLEVELDDGVYEVEILRSDGRVVELDYDARKGTLLKMEVDD